jgi:hypothetical protein
MPQRQHVLRLHFLQEYEVPLPRTSEIGKHGSRWMVRDLAEFEACGSAFEVRRREGSADTVIEAASDTPFPRRSISELRRRSSTSPGKQRSGGPGY